MCGACMSGASVQVAMMFAVAAGAAADANDQMKEPGTGLGAEELDGLIRDLPAGRLGAPIGGDHD